MPRIEKIVVATHNAGKLKEILALLAPLGITVVSAGDLGLEDDAIENGATFEENAFIKAKHTADKTNLPTLADDSGLCVDALNGRPGLYTARYGGYEKLLQEMATVPEGARQAHFCTTLAFVQPNTTDVVYFEAKSYGTIRLSPLGDGGFGYDPVFTPNGYNKTYAELLQDEKNSISCRGKALTDFKEWLAAL